MTSRNQRSRGWIPALVPFLILGGVGVMHEGPVTDVPSDESPPISTAVADDFVHVPLTLGARPGTDELPAGIEAQVRQMLDNLESRLRASGLDLSDVVRSNVFLADPRHFSAMNEVYRGRFATDPPTRATVQADLPAAGALVGIVAVAARRGRDLQVVTPSGLQSPALPYSWGVRVGRTLFVAGATSRDPSTYQPVTGDVGMQTRRVLENIGLVLRGAGMSHRDVVSCNVFLNDSRDFGRMNEVYRTFFPEAPPARATVRAGLMNPVFVVEIQCTAVQDAGRSVVAPAGTAPSTSPYSPAIRAGGRLYLAGMLGRGADGYAPGDVRAQTRQTVANIRRTLTAANLDLDAVHDVMIWITDIRHAEAVREELAAIMPAGSPEPSIVGSGLMSTEGLIEIMMIAE